MRQSLRFAFSIALGLVATTAMAEPVKFARYPHVSQGKLVFSYHGDIWIANENGSNPVRLTAHVARDTFPRLSPDGRWVAFTSDRFGNADVFVVPADRRRAEAAHVRDGARHGAELDARRQGRSSSRRAARSSPWRSPLARRAGRRRSAARRCRSTAACRG